MTTRNTTAHRAIVAWTCLAILSPGVAFTEDSKATTSAKPSAKSAAALVPDVSLNTQGELSGRLLTGERVPLKQAKVSLLKAGKVIATTATRDDGQYAFAKVAPGTYQVEVEKQLAVIRVWQAKTAPKSAIKSLDMAYAPNETVRAQFGYLDPVNTSLLLLGVTGVVLGAVAISEIKSLEDSIDKNNALNAIDSPQSP